MEFADQASLPFDGFILWTFTDWELDPVTTSVQRFEEDSLEARQENLLALKSAERGRSQVLRDMTLQQTTIAQLWAKKWRTSNSRSNFRQKLAHCKRHLRKI